MRALDILRLAALGFAVACGLAAAPAAALDLRAAETACKSFVLQSLPANAKIADALQMIVVVADGAANPCRPDLSDVPRTSEELSRIIGEIVRRQGVYDCENLPSLAVCMGLAGAADRAAALPMLPAKPTPAGRLRWEADFKWNLVYGSFGNGPSGVSLYKLVMVGAGAPGADTITPASDFTNAAPPAGECPALCKRSTAEVLSLYAILSELDWFYQQNAAEDLRRVAQAAKLVDAKWDAYLFGGGDNRVQLPWELLANSVFYKATSHPAPGDFPGPPNTAIVLLHPSVGLSLKDSKGADTNLVGVVELLGLSRWDYDGKTGARRNEWGLSAVAGYQPRDNGKDWGYGALLRTPFKGLNVVWVRTKLATGHESQWLFSVDPSSLLPKLDSGLCLFVTGACEK